MEEVHLHPSVVRVKSTMEALGIRADVTVVSDSARTALEAAQALGIEVGQVASSIVFKLPNGEAILIVTSGRHRVDTELVARNLKVEKLHRADAEFVKNASSFAIGGVAPIGWTTAPAITLIDQALADYEIIWAAAGHPHSVFPTTFAELQRVTQAQAMVVGE